MSVILLALSALSSPEPLQVVRTVRVPNTPYLTGCPGLPPTVAAEKGPRQKMRNLVDLPSGELFAAMMVRGVNCASPTVHRAPTGERRR